MEFFLDSSNLNEIQELTQLGLIDGVTTNPLLLSKQGGDKSYADRVKQIVKIVGPDKTVFSQVISQSMDTMISEAREINSWGSRMVVKLPATKDGFAALAKLSGEGIRCAITLVYSAAQGFCAAKYGAVYVAPFVARGYQVGMDGVAVVEQIAGACAKHGLECKVLGASLRTPVDVMRCINAGAGAVTVPYAPLMEMFNNPCSMSTLDDFVGSWNSLNCAGVFD
ncbi:MAG: transaldolase family protein [Clostridia bacterium]|nr:transaldolase family protein [Clostridia bacterium]